MSVGENIKYMRLNKNISQKELAEKAEISQAFLSQIEKGTKNPSLQVAYAIAKVFECDVNVLMESECRFVMTLPQKAKMSNEGEKI